MTPAQQLFEPLFAHICAVSRSARGGAKLDPELVHDDAVRLLEGARRRAAAEPRLATQYRKLEVPIALCVDRLLAMTFGVEDAAASPVSSLAGTLDPPVRQGDVDFFELLDEDLRDESESAAERAAIWHTCLCLGMASDRLVSAAVMRRYLSDLGDRMRPAPPPKGSRICNDAYEATDPRTLPQKPARAPAALGVLLACGLIVVLVGNAVTFNASARVLTDLTEQLAQHLRKVKAIPELKAPREPEAIHE